MHSKINTDPTDRQAREAAEKYATNSHGEVSVMETLAYLAGFQAATALREESEKRAVAEALAEYKGKLENDYRITLGLEPSTRFEIHHGKAARKETK